MNYHCGIAQDSPCNYNSSWNLSITWIKVSLIIKPMLPLPPYHIFYHMLFRITLMFIMFEDYSISIRPFIDIVATLALSSWPKQVFAKVRDKREARKTHLILPRMQKSVTKWTFTLPQQLPLRERVPMDSRIFRERLQGSNPLDWKVFYIIGNLLKPRCL
jgi:hypothetical protein